MAQTEDQPIQTPAADEVVSDPAQDAQIDHVAKEWIQQQVDKEVVKFYFNTPIISGLPVFVCVTPT